MGHRRVFVVSTGRTGTTYLARTLADLGADGRHEPGPWWLRHLSNAYVSGHLDHDRAVRVLRARRSHAGVTAPYLEASCLVYGLVAPLLDAFPDARVVQVVRDPRSYVRSGLAWGVYRFGGRPLNLAPFRRLAPPQFHPLDPGARLRWMAQDQFSRLCWGWSAMNAAMRRQGAGRDRFRTVRFEDLTDPDRGPDLLDSLAGDLGLSVAPGRLAGSTARPVNASDADRQDDWRSWSHERLHRLRTLTADEARHHGYPVQADIDAHLADSQTGRTRPAGGRAGTTLSSVVSWPAGEHGAVARRRTVSSVDLVALPDPSASPPPPGPDWTEGAPPDSALDRGLLEVVDRAFTDQPTPHLALSLAVVLVHRGRVVLERYGPDVDPGTTLISWSMAKSFIHALYGLALADDLVDPITPAPVPEWQDPDDPRSAITDEHLLRMCPGLRFVEDYVDDAVSHCLEMLFGDGRADMAHYAASLPLDHEPGTAFNYSSGTSNILARLLADAWGGPDALDRVLDERLFGPLGMRSATVGHDDAGTFVGSSYVFATARDFARFGLLYLRDGCWAGDRLLPGGWVDHARRPTPLDTGDERGYGAHWWLPDRGDHAGRGTFYAGGYEGQRITVVPRHDLVVVRLGKTPAELGPNLDRWIDDVIACFDGETAHRVSDRRRAGPEGPP